MSSEIGYTHAEAFDSGDLQVSALHRVHYSQYGKLDGKPVIFLHGGPGGGPCSAMYAVFFDPAIYRVVFLDQRGAGMSQPVAETRENTTQLLVQDIETLRNHVGVKKWHMVFGGSWGSTLALAYAQAHPEVCGSLVLRGIFLGTKAEFDLMMTPSFTAQIWPEEFDHFLAYLPEAKRDTPLEAYHELIMSEDRQTSIEAAREWNRWGSSVNNLVPSVGTAREETAEEAAWSMSYAKMTAHYFYHECFLEPDQLLKGCDKIKHIPSSIVQGRYDVVCPPRAAWSIHKALPQSKLYWGATAGHSAIEPDNLKKLTEVCDEYGKADFHLP